MPKNIILLSDGTGNSSAKVFKTNVWRLFQILDLRDPKSQIAFYDDGVGTSSFKLFAILGGVFGFGLKRNVIAIYSFCCRNYQPGDSIYCFGFSRGSFTIRVVAGMIAYLGLVPYDNDEADLGRFAADAYRLYRRRFNGGILKYLGYAGIDLRSMRDFVIRQWRKLWHQRPVAPAPRVIESIQFVGIWDTVDAYGGPIEEMTRAIDYWVWPLSMPDRFMSAKVHKACHALAIEEERQAFTPVIWDQRYVRATAEIKGYEKTEWLFGIDYDPRTDDAKRADPPPHLRTDLPPIDRQRISQVWFTGVHSDIGGGYPQDGLSYVAFDWMLDRAKGYGLRYFDEQRRLLVDPQIYPTDKLNDSRKGLAGYYRYHPRNILELYKAPPYKPSIRDDFHRIWLLLWHTPDPQLEILPDLHPDMRAAGVLPVPKATIHDSVFNRIKSGTDRYAPVVIPATYYFTDKAGAVFDKLHCVDPGKLRSHVQDDVWNWIWLRRVVYFLTVFAILFVAAIPYFVIYVPNVGRDSVGKFVVPIVNAVASFLPAFLEPWFVAFRNAPGLLLAGAIAVLTLTALGTNLQQTIRDVARVAWHRPKDHLDLTGWRHAVYKLRRYGIYPATFYVLTHWVFPTVIMFWLFSWLAFGTANTLGLVCRGTGGVEVQAAVQGDQAAASNRAATTPVAMDTAMVCNATGMKVTQGENYRLTLKVTDTWKDGDITTDPNGFDVSRASWLQRILGWPYRRLIWSNWFATILRVGSPGLEEHLLKMDGGKGDVWTTDFEPRSSGEVFLYVNDSVVGLPWVYSLFYWWNNHGTADVKLEKLEKAPPH
jgi:uncharacterized protein (DUF2235 family)